MANSGLEFVPWKLNQPTAIQEEIEKRLTETAKSRLVVFKGPESLGQQAVIVPMLQAGLAIAYAPPRIVTPVHVYVDVTLDDQRAADPASVKRAIGSAAAQLGVIEDYEVLLGVTRAPVPPPPPAPSSGRFVRNAALARDSLTGPGVVLPLVPPLRAPILIGAGGNPNGNQLHIAIIAAVAALEGANRPGRVGLLVSHNLRATLDLPRPRAPGTPGGVVPLIQEVAGRIGNQIVSTSALPPPPAPPPPAGAAPVVCGVLLRMEPAAADVVHTQLPTVTVLGRAAGMTQLRVEEEIAVRLLDPAAIQTIAY